MMGNSKSKSKSMSTRAQTMTEEQKQQEIHLRYIGGSIKLCPHLVESFNLKPVASLNLDNCNIAAFGCRTLSRANWPSLRTINLSGNLIGNQGCNHLAKAIWKQVINLNLSTNYDRACFALARGDWQGLSSLALNSRFDHHKNLNYITKSGIDALQGIGFLWEDRDLKQTDTSRLMYRQIPHMIFVN